MDYQGLVIQRRVRFSVVSVEGGLMKIGILGAGNVGGTLGSAWARKGHDVFFGVPNPQDLKTQELLNPHSPDSVIFGRAKVAIQL